MAGARFQASAPLRDGRPGSGRVIHEDVRCPGCGYNLRGLNESAPCPECGRNSKRGRVRVDDSTLGDAPTPYIATLGVALFVAAVAGVINFFNAAPLTYMMQGSAVSWGFGAVHIAGAIAWTGAVIVTLRPRPLKAHAVDGAGRREIEWHVLRRVALVTQLVWPGVALLRCLQFGMSSAVAFWVAHGLTIVGAAGWAAVALHTSFLADWARDDGASGRLRAAAWGFAILGLGMLGVIHVGTLEYGWTNLVFLFSGVIVLGWVASYVMLIQGALQLGIAAHWAIVNTQQKLERDQRQAERSRREAEERIAAEKNFDPPFQADATLLANLEANNPPKAAWEAPKGPVAGGSMPTVERPEGLEPYRVEDEP